MGEVMNIDEITLMARKAGFVGFDGKNKTLCKFAALVAEHEREACAKVVIDNNHMFSTFQAAESLASTIRERGTT